MPNQIEIADLPPAQGTLAARPESKSILRTLSENMGMLMVAILLFIGSALFVPNFCSWMNFKGIASSVATVGIISCTMLFCLAAGDFDLSVGSVVALAGVLAAMVSNTTHSVALGVGSGILAGLLVGVVNGVFIAGFGINALITTLATMQIAKGMAYIASHGKAIGIQETAFYALGNSDFLSIPTPVWIMLACFLFYGLLLNKTTFGRNALAIGGNNEAARLAGIGVTRIKITIFALQGAMAGFAGVILAARMTSGQPKTAEGLELQVISACVLGGVSLTGGVGTMSGAIIGVLIMGTMDNVMGLLNIEQFYKYVVSGVVLLAAVMIDRFKQRR